MKGFSMMKKITPKNPSAHNRLGQSAIPMKRKLKTPATKNLTSAWRENSVEITLISARDLENNGLKTEAYAMAWINDDSMNKQQTPVDTVNGINPTWNHCMRFTVDEGTLQQGSLLLEIAIITETDSEDGDIEIGRVNIPLKHFVQPGCTKFVTYPVQTPSGNPTAILNISVKTHIEPQQQPHGYPSYGYPTYIPPSEGYHNQPHPPPPPPSPSPSPYHNQRPPLPPLPPQPQQQPYSYPSDGYPPLSRPPAPPFQGYPPLSRPPPPPFQGYPPLSRPPPPPFQGYPPLSRPPPPPFQGYPQTYAGLGILESFFRGMADYAGQLMSETFLGDFNSDFGGGNS